jgi:hypothetical protein
MQNLFVTYSTLKTALGDVPFFYVARPSTYDIYAVSDEFFIAAAAKTPADVADFEANYKVSGLSVTSKDDALFLGWQATGNRLIAPKTMDGKAQISLWPTEGSRVTVFSHNWCDKTTWYQDAARVVDEQATDSGDHTTYTLAHQNVIDTEHGKLTDEIDLKDASGNYFFMGVKVNGVAKTIQDPHLGTGGDFTVDYAAGSITFTSAQASDAVVLVTYHYARTSKMIIRPTAGKKLAMQSVKVQFSKGITLTDTVRYEVWGQPGTPVPIMMSRITYKSFQDFINDANNVGRTMPKIGGTGWRGTADDLCTLEWDYKALIPLYHQYGMELRVYLEHDVPYEGICYATFFCLSQDE